MSKNIEKNNQKSTLKGHWFWGALVFFILLFIDLATKIGAQVYFDVMGKSSITIIPDVLILTYAENPGIAFSGAANAAPIIKLGIVFGTALIMVGATVLYLKMDKRRTFLRWCLVFVVAGGVGNLVDRVLFRMWAEDGGGVRDMVYIDFSVWVEALFHTEPTSFLYFGVCNFADFFIVGGAVALILALLFFDSDAFFPMGKYKLLAAEAETKEKEKKNAEKAKQENEGR